MSDTPNVPDEYASHPLVRGGDHRTEWFQKLQREAWNDFRKCTPADIQAMVDWMSSRYEKWEEAAGNLEEQKPELAYERIIDAWTVRYKLGALIDLLDWVSLYGPHDIPQWSEVSSGVDSPSVNGLESFIPDSTLETAERDLKMHQRFWRRRDDGEPAGSIKSDLAEEYNCSEKTVDSAVYPRNP